MGLWADEFVDDSAVGLEGCSLYLLTKCLHAEHFGRYQAWRHSEPRVQEVPIREPLVVL